MNKQAVLERLCELVALVGGQKFNSMVASDCFCSGSSYSTFQFSPEVLEYIEKAVKDRIAQEKK